MEKDIDQRPRTANESAFLFLGIMGGMVNRGEKTQADALARLLKEVAKSHSPSLEAREIAQATMAWRQAFAENPAFATRLTNRVLEGASAALQARLEMPPVSQPRQRQVVQKPRTL